MSVSAEYRTFVADLFVPFGEVSVRAMFGGGGIYHQGLMFGLIADDQIYLKVDAQNRGDFEDMGQPPFLFERGDGKQIAMSYYLIPDALYDDADSLVQWAERSFAAAQRAAASKKPKKRKRST